MLVIVATALTLAALLASAFVWVRSAERELQRLRQEHLAQAERFLWIEWWTRNAAETTRADPSRPYLVRLAYAAALAPSMAILEDDLRRIERDERNPPGLRNAARSYVQELHAAVRPWVQWEADGHPRFHPGAQAFAYAEALSCIREGLILPPASEPPAP